MCLSGVLSFEDTIKIVKLRGEIMQKVCDDIAARSAGNPPGMAAVMGLAPDQVKAIAKEAGEAYAANMNSVKQTVVSGTAEALTKLEELGKAAGARRVMRLAVAGPYHSPLMQAAADELEKVIADMQFNDPKTIFLSNVTGKAVTSGEEIKKNVILHLTNPVLWTDEEAVLGKLIQDGQAAGEEWAILEPGPGKVLCGLWKDTEGASLVSPQPVNTADNIANL